MKISPDSSVKTSTSAASSSFARALKAGLGARATFGSLLVLLSAGASQHASAASLTWDANGVTAAQTDGAGAWLGANLWWDSVGLTNTTWLSGSDAVFGNGGAGGAVTLASPTTAASITFNTFTGTYTLGTAGQALTLSGNLTNNAATGAVTFSSPLTIGAASVWTNNSTGVINISNSANVGAIAYDNLVTLAGGPITFTLTSAATTTGAGGVKINGAAVTNASTVNPFGTGTLELAGGSIINSTTATNRTISNPVSLTGNFTLGSGGSTGTNTFSGAVTTTGTRILTVNTAQSLFTNAATAFTLGGNLSVSGSGGIVISGAAGIAGTGDITIGTTGTIASTLGTGPINQTGNILNSVSGASTTSLSGVVGGTVGAITQNSSNASAVLSISGANTSYAGTTTLTAGILRGTNTAATDVLNAFGTGSLVLNGGTLQLRGNGSGNTKTLLAGNAVTIGSNAVTVDVNNNGTNTGSSFRFASLSIGTGQLTVTGGNTYGLSVGGTTTLTGNANFNPTTASVTLVGAVGDGSNGYGITKTGTGTLQLSGTNTFTGPVAVLGGTLTLTVLAPSGADGALGNATSEVLVGDTSGSVAATLQTSINTGTGIARNVRIQSGNTGAATLNSNANGSATGTLSGTITLGSDNGTGHGVTLASGAGGNAQFAFAAYSGVIQDPTGLVGAGGVVSIVGPGSVQLFGNNTYTGGTVLTGGLLRIGHLQALGSGPLTLNGGSVSQSAAGVVSSVPSISWNANTTFSATAGGINFGATIPVALSGARTTSVDNGPVTMSGVISGTGSSLRVNSTNFNGSFTFGGANTFDGGLTGAQNGTATITLISNNATGFGAGQFRLTNAGGSKASLSVDTTIASLTSGMNSITTFVGGTGGTNGTFALIFTGGGGTGAAGTATIAGNAITAVSITDPGINYTSAPIITITGNTGTGTIGNTFGFSGVNLTAPTARTLTIAGTNASPATYAGIISGTGGNILKKGSGTQTFAAGSTYTGTTTVSDGPLIAGISSPSTTLAGGAVTADNTTDFITRTGNTLVNGDVVILGGTAPTGLATGFNYYVVNQSGNTFQVSTTPGGSPVDFTSNGTTVTVTQAGAFGTTTSAIVLGDASTALNNSSPSLLTGGAFTIGRPVTVADQPTNGVYKIGGNTANTSAFTGLITVNRDLTISQLAGGTLNVSGGITGASIDTKTVTFNNAGPVNVSTTGITDGAGGGNVAVTMAGTSTTTISTPSGYTGTTGVSGGTLIVSASLDNTSQVVLTGGTFGLGAGNLVNDGAKLLMLGGTFDTGGFSETLSTAAFFNTATLSLGAGASVLHFADSSDESWSGILNITNWTGSVAGGGTDEVFFGSDVDGLSAAQVAMIKFIDPAGFDPGTYNAAILASGEVVAVVPEPSSFLALAGGLGMLLACRRSSRRRE